MTCCQSFIMFHQHQHHSIVRTTTVIRQSSSSSSSSSSKPNNNNDNDNEESKIESISNQMISLHKQQKDSILSSSSSSSKVSSYEHLNHQQEMFDNLASFFDSNESTPEEIKPILSYILHSILCDMIHCYESGVKRQQQRRQQRQQQKETTEEQYYKKQQFKILDVGCGTGALFPFYIQQANKLDIELDIIGVDLSPKMIEYAIKNANHLLENDMEQKKKHSFNFVVGDFVELIMGKEYQQSIINDNNEDVIGFDFGTVNEETSQYRGQFDAVVINACFGNFLNPGMICVYYNIITMLLSLVYYYFILIKKGLYILIILILFYILLSCCIISIISMSESRWYTCNYTSIRCTICI